MMKRFQAVVGTCLTVAIVATSLPHLSGDDCSLLDPGGCQHEHLPHLRSDSLSLLSRSSD